MCKEGSSYSDGSLNQNMFGRRKKGMRKGVGQQIFSIRELLEVESQLKRESRGQGVVDECGVPAGCGRAAAVVTLQGGWYLSGPFRWVSTVRGTGPLTPACKIPDSPQVLRTTKNAFIIPSPQTVT